MISAWWLAPVYLFGVFAGVVGSYASEIAQWMKRGGGLSSGR